MGYFLMIVLTTKSLHDAFHLGSLASCRSFVLPHVFPALSTIKISENLWVFRRNHSSFPPFRPRNSEDFDMSFSPRTRSARRRGCAENHAPLSSLPTVQTGSAHGIVFEREDDENDCELSSPSSAPLPPTSQVEGRVQQQGDDAPNATQNARRASSRSRRSLVLRPIASRTCGIHMENVGSRDSDNSLQLMPALPGNRITVVHFPRYIAPVMDVSSRPAPAVSQSVAVRRSLWYIFPTKASIALTVLFAAAMFDEGVVQVLAICTMFLGFLFSLGSV